MLANIRTGLGCLRVIVLWGLVVTALGLLRRLDELHGARAWDLARRRFRSWRRRLAGAR